MSDDSRPRRSLLGRLDDAMVPRLQRGARGVRRVVAWPGRVLARFDRRFLGGRPARVGAEHRGLVAFVAVLLAFGGSLVHVQRYPELRQQDAADAASPAEGDVAAVGPVTGARVEPYLQDRADALADAPTGRRAAVVSFVEFRTAEAVAEQIEGLVAHEVLYQVPERDPAPERLAVSGDLVASVEDLLAERVEQLEQEEADVASTLETTDDPEFREDFQARLDELRSLRNTLVDDPQVVYAVVVTGPVADLRRVASADAVRLVDLAPVGTDPDETTFHGVLPTADGRFAHGRAVDA